MATMTNVSVWTCENNNGYVAKISKTVGVLNSFQWWVCLFRQSPSLIRLLDINRNWVGEMKYAYLLLSYFQDLEWHYCKIDSAFQG